MKYDVFGIGNPLVDLLVRVDHTILAELNLKKGSMHLLDEKDVLAMLEKLDKDSIKTVPGGSEANTIAGVACLGGTVVFCGKVGDDEHGRYYEETLNNQGVKPNLAKSQLITGKAITFITPDSERTFAVHLGASVELEKEDVFEHELADSRFLHLTAYQLEDPRLRETALHAMGLAKKHNVKISIDLADAHLIKRTIEDLKKITKENAYIVFANETEAEAFTGKQPEDALHELAEYADIAVVKIGKNGSMIKKDGKVHKIKAFRVDAVDTTGAGDMYSAGILYSLAQGYDLDKAGKIASYAAAKVVEKMGARLDKNLKQEIENL